MEEDLYDNLSDDYPIMLRMYCPCPDHGEMTCTGIVLPMVQDRGIGYLCECQICGYQEIYPMPFPMAIFKDDEGDEDDW